MKKRVWRGSKEAGKGVRFRGAGTWAPGAIHTRRHLSFPAVFQGQMTYLPHQGSP